MREGRAWRQMRLGRGEERREEGWEGGVQRAGVHSSPGASIKVMTLTLPVNNTYLSIVYLSDSFPSRKCTKSTAPPPPRKVPPSFPPPETYRVFPTSSIFFLSSFVVLVLLHHLLVRFLFILIIIIAILFIILPLSLP